MGIPRDLIDLLREFAVAEVRYLLIGGYAQGFHAVPRFTKDVDFWLDPASANLERAISALTRFDFMTSVPGGDFPSAWSTHVTARWNGVPARIVSRQQLLSLKRASGRPQDLADAALLESGEET